ncbi:MAG: hypothetical protein P4L79_17385 [Legionella sp.]|uniref:hypothetical protein n=1 Tax=Legionella sp. TaxID=459 RepID=UPI0028407A8D|nr:hypothetical protein [Legionella sp.]
MKKLIIGCLVLSSSALFATSATDMNTHWSCTTNASGSHAVHDKTADDKMAKDTSAALDSFKYAAKNCRDCTKIICEVKE